MTTENVEEAREAAEESLKRIQEFDANSLEQRERLGKDFSFGEAVEPAERLVGLYQRLSTSVLGDFPAAELNKVKQLADADYTRFGEIINFDPKQPEASQRHDALIQSLVAAYDQTFQQAYQWIAYAGYRTTDFGRLDRDARATMQAIKDEAASLKEGLHETQKEADRILEEVRRVAAEKGVGHQAETFKNSADEHEKEAGDWRTRTLWAAGGLGLYAVLSMFLHRVPWLEPQNTYETVQIAVSKVLIFGVISYVMYLSARNFLAHTHNAIVDRHRQNALMTYTALVEAAGTTPNREVILVQAAHCIFAPQGTGYGHDSTPPPPGAQSVVEFMSKPLRGGIEDG